MLPQFFRRPWIRQVKRDLLLNGVLSSALVPSSERWRLLKLAGLNVEACVIYPRMFLGGTDVAIGWDCFVNYGAFLDNSAPISIGARCRLGPQVSILTSSHEVGPSSERAGLPSNSPVHIGEGCWLGARVVVLPGVTIGPGCIIAAGAVVADDCAANGLYAGVPATRKRDLAE